MLVRYILSSVYLGIINSLNYLSINKGVAVGVGVDGLLTKFSEGDVENTYTLCY